MKLRSLRSRLILASILWTAGLLMMMHMLSMLLIHAFPAIRGAHSVLAVFGGLLMMVAGFWSAWRGLEPFRALRERLAAVRAGENAEVTGQYPTEIRPLVEDLNELLAHRDRSIRRALATAGDLAHGLKTPLALLSQESEGLRAQGQRSSAEMIAQQVEKMSRQMDYHLARARAASSGASKLARCEVAPAVDGLIRAVSRIYATRALKIEAHIEPALVAQVQAEDLEEILGNLLDNACKWTRSLIQITAQRTDTAVRVTIDDDGPGLSAALRTSVLERGVRADEAAPGSGLGLAIVRDLTELYGGSLILEDAPAAGGLRATLTLPGA